MFQWPSGAIQWPREQIGTDVGEAWREFCGRRFQLAQQTYPEVFQQVEQACRKLVRRLPQLLQQPADPALVADLLRDEAQLDLLCCVAAPPITRHQLATLVGAPLDATLLTEHPPLADEIAEAIMRLLDPVRFGWLRERRPAGIAEENEAVLVVAALAAARQAEAIYRQAEEPAALAAEARKELLALGMKPFSVRKVQPLQREATAPGEFSAGPCLVEEDEADVLAGLFDRRLLALKCVVSDSEEAGAARLQAAAQAARRWGSRYGTDQLVPAVAVQGIFAAKDIEAAQATPLVIFWGHCLDELSDFVLSTTA